MSHMHQVDFDCVVFDFHFPNTYSNDFATNVTQPCFTEYFTSWYHFNPQLTPNCGEIILCSELSSSLFPYGMSGL